MKFSLHPYRGFILGAVVSALTVSGAWATWGVLRSEEAAPKIVSGNGRLDVQRVEIATKFPGQVQTIAVHEGDLVNVGDMIAQMDTTDLQRQLDGVVAMRQRATQAMARAQGARAQMALAFETTYGTAPAIGFTRMPFASTTLGSEQPLLNSELLGYGRDPLGVVGRLLADGVEHVDRRCQRERDLLDGGGARFLQVVRAHVHRVPLRRVVGAPSHHVDDQTTRGTRREDVGAT